MTPLAEEVKSDLAVNLNPVLALLEGFAEDEARIANLFTIIILVAIDPHPALSIELLAEIVCEALSALIIALVISRFAVRLGERSLSRMEL